MSKNPVVAGDKSIANPGAKLGEAIGAAIEREVNRILTPIAKENGCEYREYGELNKKGKPTKLLLKDRAGIAYNIDAVIVNSRNQPLVLIESKYIRYKKHNRDKGSWICTAHHSLRRTYPSVRKSIAVIAGSWSGTSKAMMESFGVDLYEVKFDRIISTLGTYGIDINWREKDRSMAMVACLNWFALTDTQRSAISKTLLADIEPTLRKDLKITLDTTVHREIDKVELMISTSAGEMRIIPFDSPEASVTYLNDLDEEDVLNTEDSPALWEIQAPLLVDEDEDDSDNDSED